MSVETATATPAAAAAVATAGASDAAPPATMKCVHASALGDISEVSLYARRSGSIGDVNG